MVFKYLYFSHLYFFPSLFSCSIGNFKALYQRARAHTALCNEDEARRDLARVEKMDPTFKPFVNQELRKLGEKVRIKHAHQNKTYRDMTQEKWGPGGNKTAAVKGGKKNVKFAQRATEAKTEADEKTERSKTEEKESSEKPAPAETEGVDDTGIEKNPDVKAEQSNKDPEYGGASEEGLDNENEERSVVQEDRQGATDNGGTDKDSDPAPTSTGKDNVVSHRSGCDNGRKEVECQSSATPDLSSTGQEIKATSDETENGGPQSELTNRSKLSCAEPKAAGEAKGGETDRPETE